MVEGVGWTFEQDIGESLPIGRGVEIQERGSNFIHSLFVSEERTKESLEGGREVGKWVWLTGFDG